jgi:hypothetical protein
MFALEADYEGNGDVQGVELEAAIVDAPLPLRTAAKLSL